MPQPPQRGQEDNQEFYHCPVVTKPSHTPKQHHRDPLRSNSKVLLLLSAGATSLSSHQGTGSPTPQWEERLQISINTNWGGGLTAFSLFNVLFVIFSFYETAFSNLSDKYILNSYYFILDPYQSRH